MIRAVALLVVTLTTQAQAAVCDWNNPGANRSMIDTATAIMRLTEIPEDVRRTLADMAGHRTGVQHSWRQVVATRDQIDAGRYVELRNMNWGKDGRICIGPVDRSRWPADHFERGRLFQVGPWAVIVFSACGNVAQVTDVMAPLPTREHTIDRNGWRQAYIPGMSAPAGAGSTFSVPEPGSLLLAGMALLALRFLSSRGANE